MPPKAPPKSKPPAPVAPARPRAPVANKKTGGSKQKLATLAFLAEDFASASRADSTVDTYIKHWNAFTQWCADHDCVAMPATPQTLVFFLAERAEDGIRPATLSVTLSAIAYEHERANRPSPTDDLSVKKTWRGIRRRLGTSSRKKEPLSPSDLQRMMEALPTGLIGLRDRALILLGFAGGFRRSELVALQHAHRAERRHARADLPTHQSTRPTRGARAHWSRGRSDREARRRCGWAANPRAVWSLPTCRIRDIRR